MSSESQRPNSSLPTDEEVLAEYQKVEKLGANTAQGLMLTKAAMAQCAAALAQQESAKALQDASEAQKAGLEAQQAVAKDQLEALHAQAEAAQHQKATADATRNLVWATVVLAFITAVAAGAGLLAALASKDTARSTAASVELQNRPWMVVKVRLLPPPDSSGRFRTELWARNVGHGLAEYAGMRYDDLSDGSGPVTPSQPTVFEGATASVPPGDSAGIDVPLYALLRARANGADTAYLRVLCIYRGAGTGRWYAVQHVFGIVPDSLFIAAREHGNGLGALWPNVTYTAECTLDIRSGGFRYSFEAPRGIAVPGR